jgi:pepF/M3 family oligoendopeptidase
MTPFFPSLNSPEFKSAFAELKEKTNQLTQTFDSFEIFPGQIAPNPFQKFVEASNAWNQFDEYSTLISSYIYAFVTTDAKNGVAQGYLSQFMPISAEATKVWNRFTGWVGSQDPEKLSEANGLSPDYAYFVKRCQTIAQHQMSGPEEDLAAELAQTGYRSWSRLHGDVTSGIEVKIPESEEVLPMAVVRNLAYDSDAKRRETAYFAEIARWKEMETPLAAAMNAIKGEVNLLTRRRGWESPLHQAVFETNMDVATLDAMMGAAKNAFPVFRRYMQLKATKLGYDGGLHWHDVFAPIGNTGDWAYNLGADFVSKEFHGFSKKMGDLADQSFAENWVDAEARPGKRDGAFCMGTRPGESRILMSWKESYGAVSTLAHELGHAYHNLCLQDRAPIQRETPMTLAETASIFCEAIIGKAALRQATPETKFGILEQSLQRACQTVVDISSRFLFEQKVFDARNQRSMSAEELCETMLWAQEETYGNGLSDRRHPYMWAVKPHYYGSSYYNFPYMFGHLFSLGLFEQYEKDPSNFVARYDDLLSSTGLADAATLAARFGVDISTSAFWDGSLSVIASEVELLESL